MGTPLHHLRRAAIRTLQATGLNDVASRVYYRHFHGFRSASPGLDEGFAAIFAEAARRGSLAGADYAEFGVFKGYSFWLAQKLAAEHGFRPRCFGFDSFEGLPEIRGIDRTGHGEFRKGQYACSLDVVRRNLESAGVDWRRTHLVKGYFERTLTAELVERHAIRRIGVAMIDCDLYDSTVTALAWLGPLIGDGTILIMDDWNCFNADDERGQRRATREFLAARPRLRLESIVTYGLNSEAFVVREAQRATLADADRQWATVE
ncbi:TylF/MycF/NovP-related O-methyltransferase [Falsiroseomonas sp. E2-1-a20]|uniref:TylF/MycF/NovP-related O-methyltransferase n=1 Tax=Falsiroseomonas sp. E2-1-a20 TaxID=3239300 RepID=UPI003F3930F4